MKRSAPSLASARLGLGLELSLQQLEAANARNRRRRQHRVPSPDSNSEKNEQSEELDEWRHRLGRGLATAQQPGDSGEDDHAAGYEHDAGYMSCDDEDGSAPGPRAVAPEQPELPAADEWEGAEEGK